MALGSGRAAAGEALEAIEQTGRQALAEMRRLLGVLRADDEPPAHAPQPTLTERLLGDRLLPGGRGRRPVGCGPAVGRGAAARARRLPASRRARGLPALDGAEAGLRAP